MKILEQLELAFSQKSPFVVYRKPNENIISGFFMNEDTLFFTENFSESGFVFAPFDENSKSILFPFEKSEYKTEEIIIEDIVLNKDLSSVDMTTKENHIQLVKKTIKEINTSDSKKIVISRKEEVKLSGFDLILIYKKLLQSYKNAFVYVWYHPNVGLWLGATPETLLHMEESVFKTMSLAGTQVYNKNKDVIWKSKEIDEQQLVTDFIEIQLNEISHNLKIDKTETVKAGNLLHLRTKVEGSLNSNSDLKSLIRALHPTPAVCGLPRLNAKNFILENENYNRSFYTGFLGELNIHSKEQLVSRSQLYVNLRCMEIFDDNAVIYVGGGITKDSNAEKEWEETVFKTNTVRKVL